MIDKVFTEGVPRDPLTLEVKSRQEYLAARCAYFLAVSTQSGVSEKSSESAYDPAALVGRMGTEFDIEAAMQRAKNSDFSRSTLEDPYPNLSQPTM